MVAARSLAFGEMLRRHRLAAGLTQEELAERAGVSVRGISDLERGARRAPYRNTVTLLATALHLSAAERAAFMATTGRGPGRAPGASHGKASPHAVGTGIPFVGRAHELALLRRHLTGEIPPVLLLAGEPGIGKTRLQWEAQQLARAAGWTVLAGGCQRRGGQDPYAPVLGALESVVRPLTRAQLKHHLEGCAWLVRLMPELAEQALVPMPEWALAPEQERRLMFAAASRFLANVAGPAGALLVLDDLQWAGADALDLLSALARSGSEPPLRIVGAYRSTEAPADAPLAEALADLARDGLVSLADIHPLGPTEAAELLRLALGRVAETDGEADEELVERVVQRTGGVPFFLLSCARGLQGGQPGQAPDERAADAAPQDAVPWDVAHTIRQRIVALPERSQELLRLAAVVGRSTPGALLAQVARWEEREVLAALTAATQAGLLLEETDDSYRFAHDLIREVVEADLHGRQRKALHRRVAEALEREAPEREAGGPAVEQMAYHYVRAGELERASGYLEQAGDRAWSMHANIEAQEHYGKLVEALDQLGRTTEAALARERLAEALMFLGRDDEALRVLDRAVAVYRAGGDLEGDARVTARIGWVCSGRGTPGEGLSRLEPLLGPPARDDLSARGLAALRTAQAQLYYYCGRYSEQLAVAEQAVELARAIGDELMLTAAESRRGLALVVLGRIEEAIPALEETRRLAERHGDLECLKEAIYNLGWIYDTRGEFHLARRHGERALEIVEQLGHLADMPFALFRCSLTAFLSGDWDYARAAIERAVAIDQTLGSPMISMYIMIGLGLLRQAEGRWRIATQALEEVIALAQSSGDLQNLRAAQSVLAERDLMEGRPDVARGRLEPLLDQPDHQETDVTLFLPRLAWAHLDLGAIPEAEALVEQSIARATASQNRVALLDALRVRALVATRRARWDEAGSSLDEALALAHAMPCPYSDAKVCYVYGLLHLAKGEPQQALDRFEAALAICGRLGERLYAEHIERALAELRASSAPRR